MMKQGICFLFLALQILIGLRPASNQPSFDEVPRLLFAAATGNVTEIDRLIGLGVDVNECDWVGQTALHMAADFGMVSSVEVLLRRGAKPNVRNSDYNETPFHYAAKTGNVAIFELLMQFGADVDAMANLGDHAGGTPLHAATLSNSLQAVRFLLENGADVNAANYLYHETALHLSVQNENLGIMRALILRGANLAAKDWLGNTPLHVAITRNEPQLWVAKYLIDMGAPIYARNTDGRTPLDLASTTETPTLMLLLQGQLKAGYLPIHEAAAYNNGTQLASLLSAGVKSTRKLSIRDKFYLLNRKWRDDFDRTPLHTAVQFQHFEAAKYLLNNGADVNARKWDGLTPLHLAAKTGNRAVVELLLERGALIDREMSPLKLAVSCANAFTPAVMLLIESGASVADPELIHEVVMLQNIRHVQHFLMVGGDINAKTKDEMQTPLASLLMSTCCYPQIPFLGYLIDRGASLEVRDRQGYTPLHNAIIARKRDAVIEYLLYRGANPNALDVRGCDAPLFLTTRLAVTSDHFIYGLSAVSLWEDEIGDILKILIQYGAKVGAIDWCSGKTALDLVLQNTDAANSEELANILA